MTDAEIFTAVHSIVIAVTGLAGKTVIQADDNKSSPKNLYGTIKVGTNRGQRGQANIDLSDTALTDSPIGQVKDISHGVKAQIWVDISINFFRTNARENAAKLFQANKLPNISQILFEANLGWKGLGAVNDLTALQSERREERAQVTLTLMYEQVQTVITNAIYSVTISVDNEDGDTIHTETSNAPIGEQDHELRCFANH